MAHPPFNPLDKRALGESVANALLERPLGPMPPPRQFAGAGIYAIYYRGQNSLYAPVRIRSELPSAEGATPIYVGKAVPAGSRKGGFGLGLSPGTVLFSRIAEHASSIDCADDLSTADFLCRYLIADDIWIPLGESLLIDRFKPIWNVLVDGFGNHDPGAGRRQQQRSAWDTLHLGRSWARLLQDNARTRTALESLVHDFWAGKAIPTISVTDATLES